MSSTYAADIAIREAQRSRRLRPQSVALDDAAFTALRLTDMKDQDIVWADLHHDQQQNLKNFLRVELDLAATLCRMAETRRDPERQSELRRKVRDAVDTVQRLAGRIEDRSIRQAMLDKAEDLGRTLESHGF